MGREPFSRRRRGIATALIALALLTLPITSCTMLSGLVADRPGTATAEALIVEQKIRKTLAAEDAQFTAQAATAVSTSATGTAEAAAALTATAQASATAAAQAIAQAMGTATASAGATATSQASGMYSEVQRLVKEGILASDQGTFSILGFFEKNVAKINYLTWWRTKYNPTVFVVRSKVDYESASNTANWFNAGCGFVFWDNGVTDHYRVFVALDGYVYAEAYTDGKWIPFGKGYYGQPQLPKGSYQLELVVTKEKSYVYVDGKLAKRSDILPRSKQEGAFSYTLASGTNKDFGTRCRFNDVELWEVAGQ